MAETAKQDSGNTAAVPRPAWETGHEPYVPAAESPAEFTWPALVAGTILGIVFGASSLYLVLKVGMTVSASIPVAVLSITLFRGLSRVFGVRPATILENNIVQTAGSAGESVAFGVGVTMPAVMLLGFDMSIMRVMVVSVLGGLLGILMMIPLRRAFIVKQHGLLKYPEGTACADVLIVGEEGGSSAKTVFTGFGLAFLYQLLWQAFALFQDTVAWPLRWTSRAAANAPIGGGQTTFGTVSLELNPALLGVGYIIGVRTSCIMAAGGVLAYLVLMPAIRFFGSGLAEALSPDARFAAASAVDALSDNVLRNEYVLYIGAGAVAAGGIISLFQALPTIAASVVSGLRDIRGAAAAKRSRESVPRTERDLSMAVVLLGSLLLVLAIWVTLPALSPKHWWASPVAAVLIVVFGFLFVTVSSRLTGEIGSSSNPISGMTIATLLLTCFIFLALGLTAPEHRLMALTIAAIVCVAASNGGTTSQDLKTGYLVGATPRAQQWAIVVGSVSSALVIGWILVALNDANTVYRKVDYQQALVDPFASAREAKGHDPDVRAPDGQWYYSLHLREGDRPGVPPGKYLVDRQGRIHYLVDPGINGQVTTRDDGSKVQKFDAPKTRLMALITEGLLSQKLPWTLVLIGVFLSIVLELCGVPSLPFAVGVYLPLSASTPIFLGGIVRWAADRWHARAQRRSAAAAPRPAASGSQTDATRADGASESDSENEMSPGSLMSTGYIAGGAIAGVLVAMLALSDRVQSRLTALQGRLDQGLNAAFAPWTTQPQAARDAVGFVLFLLLAGLLLYVSARAVASPAKSNPSTPGNAPRATRGRPGRRAAPTNDTQPRRDTL